MALRRTRTTSHEPPRGFEGRTRKLAAIVHAVLSKARYDVGWLSDQNAKTVSIGTSGQAYVWVGNLSEPGTFTVKDAERCAAKINEEFGKVLRSAGALAKPRTDKIVMKVYGEVIVQCPNALVLQRLYGSLVR